MEQVLNTDAERELRRAIICFDLNPEDRMAIAVLAEFARMQLRIGRHRTATARRIEREQVQPCRA